MCIHKIDHALAKRGWAVSIDGNFIVIGAPSNNGSSNQGAAYVFDLNCPANAADLTGDGTLNFF